MLFSNTMHSCDPAQHICKLAVCSLHPWTRCSAAELQLETGVYVVLCFMGLMFFLKENEELICIQFCDGTSEEFVSYATRTWNELLEQAAGRGEKSGLTSSKGELHVATEMSRCRGSSLKIRKRSFPHINKCKLMQNAACWTAHHEWQFLQEAHSELWIKNVGWNRQSSLNLSSQVPW